MKRTSVLLFLLFLGFLTTGAYRFLHADKISLKRAETAFARGEHREAILRYQEAFTEGGTQLPHLLNLAEAHLALKETGDAERIYERVLSEDAGNAAVLDRLILLNVQQGRFDRAVELHRRHLIRKPQDRAACVGFARLLAYAGRFEESAAAYRKALGEE